jgi:solute:Na+ symporter, SSS family
VSVVDATLPTGIRGFVVAAALAAMMSTASATLMAAATTLAEDVLPRLGQASTLRQDRLSTLAMGVLALAFSLALNDVFKPLAVAYDLLVGSVLVPIVGAILWKRSTAKAAIASMVVSAGVTTFFLWRDGLDANTPIFFGLASSLLVFFAVVALGDGRVGQRLK